MWRAVTEDGRTWRGETDSWEAIPATLKLREMRLTFPAEKALDGDGFFYLRESIAPVLTEYPSDAALPKPIISSLIWGIVRGSLVSVTTFDFMRGGEIREDVHTIESMPYRRDLIRWSVGKEA